MAELRQRIFATAGLLLAFVLTGWVGTWATETIHPGWPVWFVAGPMCAIYAVGAWGVWRW